MISANIKYDSSQVCFQEIPDEISFTYFITRCQNTCANCHSPQLREDTGTLVSSTILRDLNRQKGKCSCFLFMGGDDPLQVDALITMLKLCRSYGYKTALYSGYSLTYKTHTPELLNNLDYIKVGPYDYLLGGLDNESTNQVLYTVENGKIKDDITHMFRRKIHED